MMEDLSKTMQKTRLNTDSVKPLVSIIIPLLNEEKVFPELLTRIGSMHLKMASSYDVEVLLIDDGSTDETWNMIKAAAGRHTYIRGFSFARNFGHQIALTCGHEYAKGDAILTMDADLQDPPEIMERMLLEWRGGADIVLAKRKVRQGESSFKRITAHAFYRLLSFLSPVKLPMDVGDFRLLSSRANKILKDMPERSRYLRGLVGWIGLPTKIIEYERQQRVAGETKFSLSKMIKFSLDGIVSMSSRPLKLAYMFALLGSFPFLLFLLGSFIAWEWYNVSMVPGWASLLLAIVTFGSLIMIMLGVIGEYVARIYDDTKQRPHFVLRETTEDARLL
ncbi:MAG: glycosyltransferase family 2 protein [Thermodesulfovibrionales bacterium]